MNNPAEKLSQQTHSRLDELLENIKALGSSVEHLDQNENGSMMRNLYATLVNLNEEVELLKSMVKLNQSRYRSNVIRLDIND